MIQPQSNHREIKGKSKQITDLIKNIITPIAEQNTNLRKDLQTTNKRIDELNTLILDLTTKNKNKITENKIVITNKIDEINNQVTNTMVNHIVTNENRMNATLQKDNKKKKRHIQTQTNHVSTYKFQEVNKHHLHSPRQKQTNTIPVSQNTNTSRNKNVILMDSFIDY